MNTTNVKKLGRWPAMTNERADFEISMKKNQTEHDRTCLHFDAAVFVATTLIVVALSFIVTAFT